MKIVQQKSADGEKIELVFDGPINEFVGESLKSIAEINESQVVLVLKDIEYVNSIGVRTWLNFFRSFEEGKQIVAVECAPDIIEQINMIGRFLGAAKIESFFGSYECEECGHDGQIRFESSAGIDSMLKTASNIKCEKCGEEAEFVEDEDSFFAFLR